MKNDKLLTIAIPTFNRPNYLKECLESLCPHINESIQIVVRDNCSDNYTFEEFIAPYVEQYGVIPFKNDMNVGQDGNFALIFQACQTKWLLLLGDDDTIKPEALPVIIETLKAHPDDIFVKFNSDFVGQVSGISGFAKAMSGKTAFLASFFISEGFHNIEKGKNDTIFNYKFLSIRFSHIVRVMMHLRYNQNDTCYFSNYPILTTHGEDISWKHDELIIPYLSMFDYFRDERYLFKNNIFRTVACTLFHYIKNADLSSADKRYFIKQIFYKFGILNTIRFCNRTILKLCIAKKD